MAGHTEPRQLAFGAGWAGRQRVGERSHPVALTGIWHVQVVCGPPRLCPGGPGNPTNIWEVPQMERSGLGTGENIILARGTPGYFTKYLAWHSMIFLKVQNKQDLPVFLLLLNSYTLMTKRTNKKWSLKIHIHTHQTSCCCY